VKIELPRKTSFFIKTRDEIFELLQFNEKHRSFFINNTVSSNGKIYVSSKIDPLFVFIQYVELHCKTKAQPLAQIFDGNSSIFLDVLKSEQMRLVADQKGPDDLQAFIFNEEKVIKWLKVKFERLKDVLKQKNIISSGSASLNFVQSSLNTNDEDMNDEIEATALGIISEYISLDLYEKLDAIYGISEKSKEPIAQKRKSGLNETEPDSKKIKTSPDDVLKETNVVKAKQPNKSSAKNQKLEKAAKGTKSISAFFSKK
jgi:ribonuclease H2 subunit B